MLLTNNRAKLYGFTKTGIEIASRMPLEVPIHADNRRYMTVKVVRARHRAVSPPGHSTFGLRSSCERAELMLALVTRVAPVSTLAGTGSPFEAASAVLTPS